jgi:hypothetical protein
MMIGKNEEGECHATVPGTYLEGLRSTMISGIYLEGLRGTINLGSWHLPGGTLGHKIVALPEFTWKD